MVWRSPFRTLPRLASFRTPPQRTRVRPQRIRLPERYTHGMSRSLFPALVCLIRVVVSAAPPNTVQVPAPDGWKTGTPREEIRPNFRFDRNGGRTGSGAFIIE